MIPARCGQSSQINGLLKRIFDSVTRTNVRQSLSAKDAINNKNALTRAQTHGVKAFINAVPLYFKNRPKKRIFLIRLITVATAES